MLMTKDDFSRYEVRDGGTIIDCNKNTQVKIFKSNGYLQCRLVDNDGVPHIVGVHVAVAMFHCLDYFEGCIVHHEDENKQNNWSYNLTCETRSEHSKRHASKTRLSEYVKANGPANKGKKMSNEFCKKCSDSAKLRGFNGNQFIDKHNMKRSINNL